MNSLAWGIKNIFFNSVLAHCAGWFEGLNNDGVFGFKWFDLFNSILSIVFFCSHDSILSNLVFYLGSEIVTANLIPVSLTLYPTQILSLLERPCYPSNRNNSPFHAFHSLFAWMLKNPLLFLFQPVFLLCTKNNRRNEVSRSLATLVLRLTKISVYVFFWARSDSQFFGVIGYNKAVIRFQAQWERRRPIQPSRLRG